MPIIEIITDYIVVWFILFLASGITMIAGFPKEWKWYTTTGFYSLAGLNFFALAIAAFYAAIIIASGELGNTVVNLFIPIM